MSLTDAAEALAGDAQEIGLAASVTAAQAWAAGVDPEVTRGLIAAALALGCGESAPDHAAPVVQTGNDLVSASDALAADAADMLAGARRLQADIARTADQAVAAMRDARASASLEAHEIAEVNEHARRTLADCDCAAELAEDVAGRLACAVDRLAEVPDDLGAVYEPVYDLMARGGLLPYAGDWLTALLNPPTENREVA